MVGKTVVILKHEGVHGGPEYLVSGDPLNQIQTSELIKEWQHVLFWRKVSMQLSITNVTSCSTLCCTFVSVRSSVFFALMKSILCCVLHDLPTYFPVQVNVMGGLNAFSTYLSRLWLSLYDVTISCGT